MLQVVEILLREWYRDDEKVLTDISNGDLSVEFLHCGHIHPQTWEQVIGHKADVKFTPHSLYQEAVFESRVQYVVNLSQKSSTNDSSCFVSRSTYNKPVEFEITDDLEKLPALEETKDITIQRYLDTEKSDNDGHKKKPQLGPHDRVTCTSLKIYFSYLLNVLRSVVEYADGVADGEDYGLGAGQYLHPYKELYHHMPDLLKYKSNTSGLRSKHSASTNQKCDEHIDLLWDYLTSQRKVPFKEYEARLDRVAPAVTFATCWLLLKPGVDVYVREDDGSLNAYIVDEVKGDVSEADGKKNNNSYEVTVWNLAFDGTHISPGLREVKVNVFDNERYVTDLPVFPVRFVDDSDYGRERARLVGRGKKYVEYSKRPSFLQYSGKGQREGTKMVMPLLHLGDCG